MSLDGIHLTRDEKARLDRRILDEAAARRRRESRLRWSEVGIVLGGTVAVLLGSCGIAWIIVTLLGSTPR